MKNSAIEFHDVIASNFEKNYTNFRQFEERSLIFISEIKLLVSPPKKILDLGCGPGVILAKLEADNFDVIGVDGSNNMIELAKQKISESKLFQLQIPFNPKLFETKFDLIFSSSVFEYLEEFDASIEMVYNLLPQNGYFLVSLPNSSSIYRKIEKISYSLFKKPSYLAHVKTNIKEKEFLKLLEKKGFQHQKTVYFGFKNNFQSTLKRIGIKDKYNANLYLSIFKKIQ